MSTQLKLTAKDNVHHVHFGEEADTFGKDNDILMQQLSDHKLSAHLGFLQIYHRYEIVLPIPLSLWNIDKNLILKEYKDEKVPNIHCTFHDVKYSENYANVKIGLYAHKEKLLKDDIYLGTSDHGPIMCITLNARVLGKGKGTPLLRNGVHFIGIEDDSESEASDWQGFERLHVQ